jgi:hypothetical protein
MSALSYIPVNADKFRESENTQSPAHIEYLAIQSLGFALIDGPSIDPIDSAHAVGPAIELVRTLFGVEMNLISAESMRAQRDNPDERINDLRRKSRMESLAVRGTGYVEHIQRIARACLSPFDNECEALIGFTVDDAFKCLQGIPEILADRLQPRFHEGVEEYKQARLQLKRARRSGRGREAFPQEMFDLSPSEALAQLQLTAWAFVFADAKDGALVSPGDVAEKSELSLATVEAVLQAFTCEPGDVDPEDTHRFPTGSHALVRQPLLRIDERYLLPAPSAIFDAIRPRMETLLKTSDQGFFERYTRHRAGYLEDEATSLLAGAFNGSSHWTRLKWRVGEVEGELDGLVGCDDFTFRLQCKAGVVHETARRGAPDRMRRQIGDLITDAAKQHRSLVDVLADHKAGEIRFSDQQASALSAPFQFEVIVCLDDVTVWATHGYQLQEADALPRDRPLPWVLSLSDLMAVVDLLDNALLAHYVCRRLRLERHERVMAHDELDWVGNYLDQGLHFDRQLEGMCGIWLTTFTEAIDAWYFTRAGQRRDPAQKPTQSMPERLKALLRQLATQRPRHWLIAAVVALDGDDQARHTWVEGMEYTERRTREIGGAAFSMTFRDRFGMSYYLDHTVSEAALRRSMGAHASGYMEQYDLPNWVGIAQSGTGRLIVDVFETPEHMSLPDALMDIVRD